MPASSTSNSTRKASSPNASARVAQGSAASSPISATTPSWPRANSASRSTAKRYLVETALRADVALIHADRADTFGNLDYVATARNFNPLMAMAAAQVIAEAERVLPLGDLPPDDVHTPGPFVDHVVELGALTEEYAVVRR